MKKELQKIIDNQVNRFSDGDQAKRFNRVVSTTFENLADHMDKKYKSLENKVINSIEENADDHNVLITVLPNKEVKFYNDEFTYIVEDDAIENEKAVDNLKNGEPMVFSTGFMELSFFEIREMVDSERIFYGTIKDDKDSYEVEIKMIPNEKYLKREKEIYDLFLKNMVNWRTLNLPYLRKMFDLVIESNDPNIESLTGITDIEYDLDEFQNYWHPNYVPVWNVFKNKFIPNVSASVLQDTINFEHLVEIPEENVKSSFICESNESRIYCSYRNEDKDLLIISDKRTVNDLEIYMFKNDVNFNRYNKIKFPILGNAKKTSFLDKISKKYNHKIRTKGDINRLTKTYKDLQNFDFVEVNLINDYNKEDEIYEMNNFVDDEFKVKGKKEFMVMKFSNYYEDIFTYDLLSFIVAEVQLQFPEYVCKGEIV